MNRSMRWFGESWDAPVCHETPHVPTPVGEPCAWCGEPITANDRGVLIWRLEIKKVVTYRSLHASPGGHRPWHVECNFRAIAGSVGHQKRRCSCFGGEEDDPPGLSKREAARAAWEHGNKNRTVPQEGPER